MTNFLPTFYLNFKPPDVSESLTYNSILSPLKRIKRGVLPIREKTPNNNCKIA